MAAAEKVCEAIAEAGCAGAGVVAAVPGGMAVERMVSWVWWIAMLVCLLGIITSAGAFGICEARKKQTGSNQAVRVFMASVGSAVVIGGAGGIATTIAGLSLSHLPVP